VPGGQSGGRYTALCSTDGKAFQIVDLLAWPDGEPRMLGLVAEIGATIRAPEIDASFDFFEVCEPADASTAR